MAGLGVLGKSNQSLEAESQVAGRRNAGMAPLGTSEGRRGFLGTTRIGTGAVLGPTLRPQPGEPANWGIGCAMGRLGEDRRL
ncbi:hypothetical protein CDEST_12324 [Colletotrichum destructivum]|uniref:Uncharacterized protein n=1 Tax=Colletotrichum destructivum TaxID=34406 RepID=A0AAX4IVN2_9PEZI|nr:hypothetical protein CDEST_12324 [Colletotrichum destructivum]